MYGCRVKNVYAWSDSTIVLSWLDSEASRWPIFIANRIAQIQRDLPTATWRYVPSEDNPADLASRGVGPDALREERKWWSGPDWLSRGAKHWPHTPQCFATVQQSQPQGRTQMTPESEDLTSRFSTLGTLTSVVARCLRWSPRHRPKNKPLSSPPSATELSKAYLVCVRLVQEAYFQLELTVLRKGHGVQRHSSLGRLNPFLDPTGVIQVGGRLDEALLPYSQRHPVILPKKSHLARLVVDRAHRASLHGGHTLTYAYTIRDTWVIGGRVLVRAFVRKCVICAKSRPRPSRQLMGDLPQERIARVRAFAKTGLDYAGPFYLKASKGRGIRTTKGYLAVFVCLATKAVHLEIVGDLTTDSFIAALKRFTARRGKPNEIWSDNATTFHGADAELRAVLRKAEIDWGLVSGTLTKDMIIWRFIPPAAPHFGGLWEAAVKSAKSYLKRVIGQRLLTYEEMSTLTAQVELVLNSRPLIPLSGDINDCDILTPGHILAGFALNAIPEPSSDDAPASLDRMRHWRLVQALRNRFWIRWSRDYLNTLQQRIKWQERQPNLAVGDIVLVLDPSMLRLGRWPLGRIISTHPGSDGLVRAATVRTHSGEYVRPITNLCKLPVESGET